MPEYFYIQITDLYTGSLPEVIIFLENRYSREVKMKDELATTIHIRDLAKPKAHRVLDGLAKIHLDLTTDHILSISEAITGLHDFGQLDFYSRLEKWIEYKVKDTDDTNLGRAMAFRQCVELAVMRLRIIAQIKESRSSEHIDTRQPIIVTGLPRSGTTHMHGLLAAHPSLETLRQNECADLKRIEFCEPSLQRLAHLGIRGSHADSIYKILTTDLRQIGPYANSMRPMDPSDVEEELEIMLSDFPLWALDWTAVDKHRCALHTGENKIRHYRYLVDYLRTRRADFQASRWVLGSPVHSIQMDALAHMFPDAVIVFMNRDPLSIVQSVVTMVAYHARVRYRRLDVDSIINSWVERIECCLKSISSSLGRISCNVMNIEFHDFMKNEIDTACKIFDFARVEVTDGDIVQMERFLSTHPRNRHGRVSYDLWSSSSIDVEQITKRLDQAWQLKRQNDVGELS